jgi:hypothetical protein
VEEAMGVLLRGRRKTAEMEVELQRRVLHHLERKIRRRLGREIAGERPR